MCSSVFRWTSPLLKTSPFLQKIFYLHLFENFQTFVRTMAIFCILLLRWVITFRIDFFYTLSFLSITSDDSTFRYQRKVYIFGKLVRFCAFHHSISFNHSYMRNWHKVILWQRISKKVNPFAQKSALLINLWLQEQF